MIFIDKPKFDELFFSESTTKFTCGGWNSLRKFANVNNEYKKQVSKNFENLSIGNLKKVGGPGAYPNQPYGVTEANLNHVIKINTSTLK